MEELKQGSNFHIGASESREKHLRLRGKQLICGSLNGMRIRQSLLQPYVPQMAQQPGAGVQGLWSNPRARAAVDCRDTDQGDVREETVVGNACGGKLGSHGSKAILLSHVLGWSHHHSLSPPTGQPPQLHNREAGP